MSRKRKQEAFSAGGMHDLDVPIILTKNQGSATDTDASLLHTNTKKTKPTVWRGTRKEQSALIQRLGSTGYSTIALSHQVHGRVKPNQDEADIAIPDSIVNYFSSKDRTSSAMGKGNKRGRTDFSSYGNLKILKRLNVIIEQESDLAFYGYGSQSAETTISMRASNSEEEKTKEILQSYDLIALSARNETVLSAICNSQNIFYADIIMLDYSSGRGGVQLPFKLKKSYVSSASKNGLTFEIPYGPALIDPAKRKALVQASRQFINASVGVLNPRPALIVSSGGRVLDGRDYGAMVLRSSSDILNFCKVVLGLNMKGGVSAVLNEHACTAVKRGTNRKNGKIGTDVVTYKLSDGKIPLDEKSDKCDNDEITKKGDPFVVSVDSAKRPKDDLSGDEKHHDGLEEDDDDDEDGFLRL